MFEEGNIIYFDPFYFKNGNTAKPKYFVVLKQTPQKNILASLPTRKETIPQNENVESGCLELPDINLNCFIFSKDMKITECGKSFPFRTFLYGHQIEEYDTEFLKEIYPNEGSDFEIWGKLKQELFENLVLCFKQSRAVKRKFRKALSEN